MTEPVILTSAYILDLVIGDPRWLPHPVRFMGWGVDRMERALRGRSINLVNPVDDGSVIPAKAGIQKKGSDSPVKLENDKFMRKGMKGQLKERLSGVVLVITTVGSAYGLFHFLNSFFLNAHLPVPASYPAFMFLVYLVSTTLATNDLIKSGKAVINALNTGKKEEAREKLSIIVGRDTKHLGIKEISKATIETLSENASDGIIAPMFYFAIGGLPLAMAYKAVNTLDSMVGYRNEKYKDFGWAAARLDDIANYIPARITGILIFAATFILSAAGKIGDAIRISSIRSGGSNGLSSLNCLKIMLTEGRNHLSPNSGIPEAAMAGALGVRLGGPSLYGGILVEKPYIGEEKSGAGGQGAGVKGQVFEHVYLNASEKALLIVRLTSLFGLCLALIFLYLRTIL